MAHTRRYNDKLIDVLPSETWAQMKDRDTQRATTKTHDHIDRVPDKLTETEQRHYAGTLKGVGALTSLASEAASDQMHAKPTQDQDPRVRCPSRTLEQPQRRRSAPAHPARSLAVPRRPPLRAQNRLSA